MSLSKGVLTSFRTKQTVVAKTCLTIILNVSLLSICVDALEP